MATQVKTGLIANDAITSAHIGATAITHADLHTNMDLTGKTVLVANASTGDNDTTAANTAFVQQELAALVDSAPGALNTLNELAAALGDDANFSTTVTNSIATKLPLAGGTMSGALNMGSQNITNVANVISPSGSPLVLTGDSGANIELYGSGGSNNIYIDAAQVNYRGTNGSGTGSIAIGTTVVIDGSRNLTNIGTISSGDITVIDPVSSNFNGKILVGGAGSNRRLILSQADVLTYKMGGTGTNSITQLVSGGSAGVGTVGLTLDASQNATFAGTISSGTITSSNSISMNAGNMTLKSTSDGNQAFRYYRADGTLVSQQYPYNNRINWQTYNNQGLRLKSHGTGQIELEGNVVVNEDSADVNFRVESNTNQHALHVEGDSSRVGVGIAPTRNAGHVVVNGTESASNGGITYYSNSHTTYRNICNNSTTAGSHRYWHVKTNIHRTTDAVMFVAKFHGYAYGSSGYTIDVRLSGYNYTASPGSVIGSQVANIAGGSFSASTYYASDSYLVLVLDFVGGYYTGVVMDFETPSPAGYNYDFKVLGQGMSANSTGLY